MLPSVGRHADAVRCRELGIQWYLTKPVCQSDLLEAILQLLRKQPARRPIATLEAIERKPLGPALRILLAEDNLVNRKLAVRLLEKRGHSVILAENGRQAVEALTQDRFDVVLMDVQMPVMNGLDASKAIREWERHTGRRTPIIALTAHAMEGDRQHCLDAGMDDYVPKPLQAEVLFRTIGGLCRGGVASGVQQTTTPPECPVLVPTRRS